MEYAKYIGPKVLKFYEDYFDIKFPLPKVDMIAIPDFSAGAMENWVRNNGVLVHQFSFNFRVPNRVWLLIVKRRFFTHLTCHRPVVNTELLQ